MTYPTMAGRSTDAYTTQDLVLSTMDLITQDVTVLSGQNLLQNTVVGRVTIGAGTGAKISGTGDGTIGAVTLGVDAMVGVYKLTGKTEAANGGTFQVEDPQGNLLPDLTVAVAYTGDHINLTVADGAADWDIGDIIHVTVAAGSGKIKKSVTTATDGSDVPVGILCNAVDATSSDLAGTMYIGGDFNQEALVWDASYSTDLMKQTCFDRTNIVVRKATYSVG